MAAGQIRSHAGLRGVAALLVVAYHLQFGGGFHLAVEDETPLFRRSYLFVDLFFVLSGFILSHVNRAERQALFAAADYRDFLLRRLIRLYPLVLFTLSGFLAYAILLDLGCRLAGRPNATDWSVASLLTLAQQYLLLNAWLPNLTNWNTASWSISAEMGAYLLFPLAVGLHARRPRYARALLLAFPLAYYAAIAATTGSLDIIALGSPLRCLAGFALGMSGFYLRERFAAWPPARLGAVQALAVAAIVAVLASPSNDVLVMPGFFLLVMTSWTDRGPIARALGTRAMVTLGDLSYSVYLNHLGLFLLLGTGVIPPFRHFLPLPEAPARALVVALHFGVVLLVSHFTFHHVEAPSRRWLARRLLGHQIRPIAASPAAP